MLPSDQLAFLSLGSNQGDSAANVLRAFSALRALSSEPLLVSSLWETEPVDCPPGSPPFINAVVGVAPLPGETPESLLDKLQRIESQFGRRSKQILNEPRPLDLDLVAFGKETRASATLTLPHPRAHQRRFVLAPLNELAPHLRLPGHPETVSQLLSSVPLTPAVRLFRPASEANLPTTPRQSPG
jgi:2-amino-4-hydroxy-6-hydroxymethyldihydropteridine diphosphokinase